MATILPCADAGLDAFVGLGLRVCPRRLSDLVGADIGLHVGSNFLQEWPDRTYKAYIFKLMNDNKLLGEKTGAGFYTFAKDKCAAAPAARSWLPPRPLQAQQHRPGARGTALLHIAYCASGRSIAST